MGIAIEAHNLGKRYRVRGVGPQTLFGQLRHWARRTPPETFWAIREADFTIEEGMTVGVIGPNGAGKSSTLGLAAGTIRPTEGSVVTNGRISSLLELGAGFHPDLSGRENIYLNAALLGVDKAWVDQRFDAIVEFAEIADFIDQPVKTYSSGMYVRLGFAVATEVDPDILLVDEVLAVGDLRFQTKCLRRFREFKQAGKTILFVSHDLGTVEAFCDEVLLIEQGHITRRGPAREVVAYYRERFADHDGDRATRIDHTALVPKDWGSKRLELTAVRLLDQDGKESDCFTSGDPMTVEVDWKTDGPVENPVFGFALNKLEGDHLFGTNSFIAGNRYGTLEGRGTVRICFKPLTLWGGRFAISIAAHNEDHTEQFHRLDHSFRFEVDRGDRGEGYYYFHADWEMGS